MTYWKLVVNISRSLEDYLKSVKISLLLPITTFFENIIIYLYNLLYYVN